MMPRSPRSSDRPVDEPEDVDSNVQGNETAMSPAETDSSDSIARRAYDRFHARGGEHGRDQEDWLEAERELNNKEPE